MDLHRNPNKGNSGQPSNPSLERARKVRERYFFLFRESVTAYGLDTIPKEGLDCKYLQKLKL